ncbi:MAG: hypothetical protein HYR84_09880 [Planctomycetes bacterium]|nr:hypothetical protein [Planctomycetota bacterium]
MVTELVDAGRRFLEEFDKTFPIAAAFWLKDRDESGWSLHIASDKISDADRQNAFAEMVRITTAMKYPYLGPTDIKLRRVSDRIVQFALDFRRRYPAPLATVFNVPTFEGVEVEGMYLYPPRTAPVA